MKAVVFHGIGDIRLEDVREPKLKEPTDAIVALTASAICGTDLHMIRGTLSGMQRIAALVRITPCYLLQRPLGAIGTLASISRVIRYRDVAATSAEKPLPLTSSHHGFEIASLHTVRTSDDLDHWGFPG